MKRKGAPTRDRSRGVAVLEFTLSLVFLVPLLMATLSFGYYFYIGSNAEEAARQGLGQALAMATPCAGLPGPPVCAAAVAAAVTAPAVGTPPSSPCTSLGAAACYMNADPLNLGTAANTTVTCLCATGPTNPTYTIGVQVDFIPAVEYFRSLFPAGTAPRTIRYTATLAGN